MCCRCVVFFFVPPCSFACHSSAPLSSVSLALKLTFVNPRPRLNCDVEDAVARTTVQRQDVLSKVEIAQLHPKVELALVFDGHQRPP